jgi:glycosyltransferase involved in cell wall biosynthesis
MPVDPDSVIFSGVMDYPPNEDAALYFCREIMPLLEKRRENVKFIIAGKNPTEKIIECASDKVIVTGYIKDLMQAIAGSAVVVSPLRYGTGVKNKILEAMAMGKAVAGSSLSFEGIEDLREGARIADEPQELADNVAYLLDHPVEAKKLGTLARAMILDSYNWNRTFSVVASRIDMLLARSIT